MSTVKMEMCRSCLSTSDNVITLDDISINNYNLLTNLNVSQSDGLPQQMCKTCIQAILFFVSFRSKCINAENTLRGLQVQNNKNKSNTITTLEYYNNVQKEIKVELVDIKAMDLTVPHDTIPTINAECPKDKNICENNSVVNSTNFENAELEEEYKEDVIDYETDEVVKPVERRIRKPKKTQSTKTSFSDPSCDKTIQKRTRRSKTIQCDVPIKLEDSDPLSCGLCTQTFENNDTLNEHLEGHKKDKWCELCQIQFSVWPQALGHRNEHVPDKERNCYICGKYFKLFASMEYHYMNKHYEGEKLKPFCYKCSRYFSTKRKLTKHVWAKHTHKFICDHCSKCYPSKRYLERHIQIHLNKKNYMCDMCGFSCNFSGGLTSHKLRVHNTSKVICKTCQRVFPSEDKCRSHQCKLTQLQCPVCGKMVKRLSRHMRAHTDVHRYKCDRCPSDFKAKASLAIHLNMHDGKKTKACEYCSAKFYYLSALIKHRRIHTGEKPYVCYICGKGFTGGNNLKVHMKVHGKNLIVKKNSMPLDFSDILTDPPNEPKGSI